MSASSSALLACLLAMSVMECRDARRQASGTRIASGPRCWWNRAPYSPPPDADLSPPDPNRTDLATVELARQVPGGFAGIGYRGDKRVLMLVSPRDEGPAKSALRRLLPSAEYSQLHVEQLRVIQVRWSYSQLFDWYRYLLPHRVAGLPVSSAAIDGRSNRIRISVPDATAEALIRARLDALRLPCDLVTLTREPYAVP